MNHVKRKRNNEEAFTRDQEAAKACKKRKKVTGALSSNPWVSIAEDWTGINRNRNDFKADDDFQKLADSKINWTRLSPTLEVWPKKFIRDWDAPAVENENGLQYTKKLIRPVRSNSWGIVGEGWAGTKEFGNDFADDLQKLADCMKIRSKPSHDIGCSQKQKLLGTFCDQDGQTENEVPCLDDAVLGKRVNHGGIIASSKKHQIRHDSNPWQSGKDFGYELQSLMNHFKNERSDLGLPKSASSKGTTCDWDSPEEGEIFDDGPPTPKEEKGQRLSVCAQSLSPQVKKVNLRIQENKNDCFKECKIPGTIQCQNTQDANPSEARILKSIKWAIPKSPLSQMQAVKASTLQDYENEWTRHSKAHKSNQFSDTIGSNKGAKAKTLKSLRQLAPSNTVTRVEALKPVKLQCDDNDWTRRLKVPRMKIYSDINESRNGAKTRKLNSYKRTLPIIPTPVIKELGDDEILDYENTKMLKREKLKLKRKENKLKRKQKRKRLKMKLQAKRSDEGHSKDGSFEQNEKNKARNGAGHHLEQDIEAGLGIFPSSILVQVSDEYEEMKTMQQDVQKWSEKGFSVKPWSWMNEGLNESKGHTMPRDGAVLGSDYSGDSLELDTGADLDDVPSTMVIQVTLNNEVENSSTSNLKRSHFNDEEQYNVDHHKRYKKTSDLRATNPSVTKTHKVEKSINGTKKHDKMICLENLKTEANANGESLKSPVHRPKLRKTFEEFEYRPKLETIAEEPEDNQKCKLRRPKLSERFDEYLYRPKLETIAEEPEDYAGKLDHGNEEILDVISSTIQIAEFCNEEERIGKSGHLEDATKEGAGECLSVVQEVKPGKAEGSKAPTIKLTCDTIELKKDAKERILKFFKCTIPNYPLV